MATKAAILKPSGAPKSAPLGAALAVQSIASGEVALPADLAAELAGYAKDAAATERPKISKVSLKSGMMTYMQQQLPNNEIDVVVLAAAFRNTWYSGSYDPDNITNPACFAIALSQKNMPDMVPHENVKNPVHPTCSGCPKSDWGTAMRDGKPSRGKACKEGRRLLVMPVAALDSAESVATAEVAVVDVPVTSVNNWAVFLNTLAGTLNLPPWACITKLQVRPHMRNQMELVFTPMERITSAEIIRAIQKRLPEAERYVTTPWDEADLAGKDEEKAPAKAPAKTKFR